MSDYVAILRRRVWVIVPAVVLVGGLAYLNSTTQSKVYRANAEILLSRQTVSTIVTGIQNQDALADPVRYAQTQAELARSPEVANQAVTRAAVDGHSAGALLENSRVSPSVNADLLRFTVDDSTPAVAARLAQAYAEAFTDYRISLNTKQLAAAYNELQGRLAQLRDAGQQGTALYRQLAANAQQLRTLELLQTPDVVVKPAVGASQIAPRPLRAGLLGAGLGLLLGLALGFLWEALDKRVRTEGEIEEALDLPILARVPPPALGKRGGLWMIHNSENPHADAVRRLRTNLEFANLDRKAQMIMVTSAVQEEGKSTTAADLAIAFAQAGRDVTLVDLDLRRPMVAEMFGLRPGLGLTDIAVGRTTLDEALETIPLSTSSISESRRGEALGSLRVLQAGTLPASPGQFIGTEALAHTLQQVREEHSLVLVDTPPLLAVGDAASLAAHMDGIVVIARMERITRSILARLAHELRSSGTSKLGVVVTGVKMLHIYGYGYQHREPHHASKKLAAGGKRLLDRRRLRISSRRRARHSRRAREVRAGAEQRQVVEEIDSRSRLNGSRQAAEAPAQRPQPGESTRESTPPEESAVEARRRRAR